jgi:hypothetical protein
MSKWTDPTTGVEHEYRVDFIYSAEMDAFCANRCQHKTHEIAWFKTRSGGRQLRRQCLRCYEPFGEILSHDNATPDTRAANFVRRDAYRADRQIVQEGMLRRCVQRTQEWEVRYGEYLNSEQWGGLRSLVMKRAGGRCEGCGRQSAVHVHHLSYAHVFDEFLFELVAVCLDCHHRLHPEKWTEEDAVEAA